MQTLKLPTWFTVLLHALPWGLGLYFLIVTFVSPELMSDHLQKDSAPGGGGIVEHLTVIVLIPGIILGFYGFFKYRSALQPAWTAYWLLIWSIACFYFAGEEISWGQWYFQWQTPEAYALINDQHETNLHNTSTWFDQKPRTLVEIWIFIGGFILPLIQLLKKQSFHVTSWKYWFYPSPSLISAGLFFTAVRFSGWSNYPPLETLFGSSELRELCVALFLSFFLISFSLRLKQLKH